MKITIIFPPFPFSERFPVVPPILEYLAALTRREDDSVEVELVDANQTPVDPSLLKTDLVAISTMTVTAPWVYHFADACRSRGIPVVLGGIHATALPEEAVLHSDAVVIGEAESVWKEVLSDAGAGSLKRLYYGRRLSLNGLPMPVDGGLKGNYRFRAFFTMRGYPYSCTFCSVPRFFGEAIRCRPIPEVAAEIEARAGKLWFNGDDNIWGGDIDRNIALFNRLSEGSRKYWFGFGDLKTVQGNRGGELLTAARKSGLFSVMVGWESGSTESLKHYKALGKQGAARIEAIKMIQSHGIYVVLFVVLGGRQDSVDSFRRTLEIADSLNVGIHPILLMPLPGTELNTEYNRYLLPGLGWEHFTGLNALFTHPDPEMTPKRREEEYHKLRLELFKPARVLKRIARVPLTGFPSTHFLALMKESPMKKEIHLAYREWLTKNGLSQ